MGTTERVNGRHFLECITAIESGDGHLQGQELGTNLVQSGPYKVQFGDGSLDAGLTVTPPKGLGLGYDPIFARQENTP